MRDIAKPKHRRVFDIAIGIPAYNRCSELSELLGSIYAQTVLPREITICEDNSPEREAIRKVAADWGGHFAPEGCIVNYQENDANLGFDGNFRKVISASHARWVMVMGNDDLMLDICIETTERYLLEHPGISIVSRSFLRFSTDITEPLGISRLSEVDCVFRKDDSSAKMIFRTCGFIPGLVFDRTWADANATNLYDGTLYYQIYLASIAFCESGIGYIAKPIVAGRSGNPPMFGVAASEQKLHIPGSYSPKGRANMWASVLRISREIGNRYSIDLYTEMKSELEVRQSFHIFEMYAGADREVSAELRRELIALDLFSHPMPRLLYALNRVFGRRANAFYVLLRKIIQRD